MQLIFIVDLNIAAKRHKMHKNNNSHIEILNSYRRKKYKFGLFTWIEEFRDCETFYESINLR
ncbi:MAG: hypothetical protein B1H12_09160 [Desulfobacteraceae bacterium 4484_190.2]|nr:MAG: hypothetical protein B1H12_09160 [Desulfobacteraceae bacterium 4484_190.2]